MLGTLFFYAGIGGLRLYFVGSFRLLLFHKILAEWNPEIPSWLQPFKVWNQISKSFWLLKVLQDNTLESNHSNRNPSALADGEPFAAKSSLATIIEAEINLFYIGLGLNQCLFYLFYVHSAPLHFTALEFILNLLISLNEIKIG